VRTAGGAATLMSATRVTPRFACPPVKSAGERNCYAPSARSQHRNKTWFWQSGRSRHLGIRPITRGVSRNPWNIPTAAAPAIQIRRRLAAANVALGSACQGYRTRNRRKHSTARSGPPRPAAPWKNPMNIKQIIDIGIAGLLKNNNPQAPSPSNPSIHKFQYPFFYGPR